MDRDHNRALRTGKTLDLRAQRSRQWMREALMALILEQDYEKISVSAIASRARVARPTFYLHYKDKDDLLVSSLDRLFEALNQEFDKALAEDEDKPRPHIPQMLFEQARHNPALFRVILSGRGGGAALRRFQEYAAEILQRFIVARGFGANDPVLIQTMADYVTGAILNMIFGWLERDMPYSPEAMARIFSALTSPGMRDVLTHGFRDDEVI